MDVGVRPRQHSGIRGDVLPDAGIGSCKGKDHGAGPLANYSASLVTVLDTCLGPDEPTCKGKTPFLQGDFLDRVLSMRFIGELGKPHQRSRITDPEIARRRVKARERILVVFARVDFDECAHDLS